MGTGNWAAALVRPRLSPSNRGDAHNSPPAPPPSPTAATPANQTTPDMAEVPITLDPPPVLSPHCGGNACNPVNPGQGKGTRHPSVPGGDASNARGTSSYDKGTSDTSGRGSGRWKVPILKYRQNSSGKRNQKLVL